MRPLIVLPLVLAAAVVLACADARSSGENAANASDASTSPTYPAAPIQYILPFAPGGESDLAARFQQPIFAQQFGEDLVVSYKPGGGGAVGWSQLNGLMADGYTIMGVNLPHIVIQPLQGNVGYATDDIAPVHFFHYTPDALVVRTDSPLRTVDDLIEQAGASPGALTVAGSGKWSANHIAQVRFDGLAAIRTSYVAFGGTGGAITALLGGQVDAQWGYTSAGATYRDQVRLLAVAMDARHPQLPDVPTFRELGYELVSGAYRGVAMPRGASETVKTRLSEMMSTINRDPTFVRNMEEGGFALIDVTYDQMSDFMAEKRREYEAAARAAGLTGS